MGSGYLDLFARLRVAPRAFHVADGDSLGACDFVWALLGDMALLNGHVGGRFGSHVPRGRGLGGVPKTLGEEYA